METALDKKQQIIQEFSKKKDLLHQQLDDKTERIENLKQRLLEAENRKVTTYYGCIFCILISFAKNKKKIKFLRTKNEKSEKKISAIKFLLIAPQLFKI